MKTAGTKKSPFFTLTLMIVIIFLAEGALCLSSAEALTLRFRSTTELEQGDIYLGSIAAVEGSPAEDLASVREMWLGSAPAAGRERVINTDYVVMRLLSLGFDREQMEVEAPERVAVIRKSQNLDVEQVRRAVMDYLQSQLPPSAVIEITRLPESMPLPLGEVEYRVQPLAVGKQRGPFYIYVDCRAGGETRRVNVGVDVGLYEQVVVAARHIDRGTILTADDLKYEFRDVSRLSQNICRNVFELVGKQARRVIAEDVELTENMLEAPSVIRAGQPVTLVARFGEVVVNAPAEARQNGRVGDVIRVRNTASHATIQARVINAETVESVE